MRTTETERPPEASLEALSATARRLAGSAVPNSCHLLLALLRSTGVAGELLRERRLDERELGRQETVGAQFERLEAYTERARELARSQRAKEASGVHLLMALLNARSSLAHRALVGAGIDLPRLRAVCVNAGLGLVTRRCPSDRNASQDSRGVRSASNPSTPNSSAPNSSQRPAPVRPSSSRLASSSPPSARPRTPPAARPVASAKLPPAREAQKRPRFALDPKKHKLLRSIGINLTAMAAAGELAGTAGRKEEVERVLDVLAKQRGNSVCLVGPPGVGKTSLVHALSHHIAEHCFDGPDERTVVEIPVAPLLQGTGLRGALAGKVSQLFKEAESGRGRIVLFFDDVHQLFAADPGDEVALELKRALCSGSCSAIATTTPERYAQLESASALVRCFLRVEVQEPELDDASAMLELAAQRLQTDHGVDYPAETLAGAVIWCKRYLPGAALPDRAISLLDLASARCRRRGETVVARERVAEVVAELARVPVERLLESDAERLLGLEHAMAEHVVGHEEQIRAICRVLRRNAAGLGGKRPIGTFLLLGPTGVGKTETAKALSEVLFGSERALSRFDLSEYSESHSVARLIGAPPGYVGFEAGGQLTEAVRRRPHQVLLLDEVEKAHPEVLAAFLPLFDEGRLTDGQGRTADFTNTVILLTSNLGAKEAGAVSEARLGFGNRSAVRHDVDERVKAAARRAFSPEFYNRLDETLVFRSLSEPEVEAIARRLLQDLADRVFQQRGVELVIDVSVVKLLLAEGGFDAALGARPMRRAIGRSVEAPLAEALLRGSFSRGSRVRLAASHGELTMRPEPVAAE